MSAAQGAKYSQLPSTSVRNSTVLGQEPAQKSSKAVNDELSMRLSTRPPIDMCSVIFVTFGADSSLGRTNPSRHL